MCKNHLFKNIFYYLNSAPASCRDPWIWLCVTLSCVVLSYLNLRALLLYVCEFFLIFVLIEGVDWNNFKWNFRFNMMR